MPPLREVSSLLDLSVNCVHHVVRDEALRVAKVVEQKFFYEELLGTEEYCFEMHDSMAIDREIYLSDQITAFKEHVLSHLPLNLVESVIDPIVFGISLAIWEKKKRWTPTTNMSKFTKSMYAITMFANVVVIPSRKVLDIDKVPKVSKIVVMKIDSRIIRTIKQ